MSLFSELRRRNVHRMAALYLVAAWLVMQVAEVVVTLAELPSGFGQIVLILLAVGFPITLVFSWFYELTPEGVTLDTDAKASESFPAIGGRRLDFIVIALLCAAVLVFAYDKWWMSGPPITSVAVLPLDSLSADPEQEYFADGMTDVLTGALAQIDGLQVISRTSAMRYKATDKSIRDIARELDVDALIEGSVQQTDKDVLFTLQLIDGRTDRHLWSKSYQRNLRDVLTLQGEVAGAIADEVEVALAPRVEARLVRNRTVNPDALWLWTAGNHHLKGLEQDSFLKALQAFEEAVRLDPGFADAHAGIARSYAYLGSWHATVGQETTLPLAKAAVEKATQLDPDLAEAHFVKAAIHLYEWNWEAADHEYRTGLKLSPSDSIGLAEYANFLGAMGRVDEAVEIAAHAVQIDPLSPAAHNELGMALSFAGQRDAGIESLQKALQLDPEFHQTLWILADTHFLAGDYDKALEFMEKYRASVETQTPSMIGYIGHYYAALGQSEDARDILSTLLKRRETEYVQPTAIASVYTSLGESDEALRWLETAYAGRDSALMWLKYDPMFDSLRSDPRFKDLVARMNFPDAAPMLSDQELL